MSPTRRQFLGAATASTVAGLAGCPGDDGTASPTDTPTESPTETPTAPPDDDTTGAVVAVNSHPEYGDILVDGDGLTLYMFDSDTQGELASACSGGCAEAWPPLTSEGTPQAGDGVTADLQTFEREDGSTQVAAGGWPLYYFQNDASPGDANGQGVNDVWWVLGPDGTPKRPGGASVAVSSHPDHGDILVDGDGRTLYMFDPDTQGEGASACYDGCADAWPPLTTEAEPAPGDANGQGVNDVWWVLGPDGVPKRPEQATVGVRSHPDYGDILVDGDGMTLYMFDQDDRDPPSSACTGGCAENWPPLGSDVAPEVSDDVAAGVETFERPDGSGQVTAEGWPLYYYAPDESPGDAMGQGVNDAWWVLDASGTPQRTVDVGGSGGY